MKEKKQRNFETDAETEQKLIKLRNYHNQSFNKIYRIIVDNAFASMEETKSIGLAEKLDAQYIKVDHQMQQLSLMFGAYKSELEKLKIENSLLRGRLEDTEKQAENHATLIANINKENIANYERIKDLRNTKMNKILK